MQFQTVARDNSRLRLISIPLEVLHQIVSNLTTPEYGNLRCTCKDIEAALFNSFSREFFTKRQFMFTEFSLQALVDISKSRLSSCLSYVIFGLERPSQVAADPQPDMHVKDNRSRQESVDHMSLINTGQDVEMLAEAFSNLDNLETIGMRDFNSRSRNRDYPNIEWKSYGVSTFELETGCRLEVPRQTHTFDPPAFTIRDWRNYLSRTFLNLLRALGKAHSQPKHFEVILRSNGLHDHAFNLPKYADPVVQPILANLRTLFLDLALAFPPAQVDMENVPVECPSCLLRKFLSRVPQLEHLRLNFQFYQNQETNDVLSWLSMPVSVVTSNPTSGTSLLEPPRPIDFINLQQLDIGMTAIEPQILLAIIRKYRATLRTISFHKVSLLQADPVKPRDRVNLWARFFGQLSKLDLNLSTINMSFLSQEHIGGEHVGSITFKDSRHPKLMRWAGTDVQSGLRDFKNHVMVNGLEHDTESSYGGESGEEYSGNSISDIHSDTNGGDEVIANEIDL